MPDKQENNTSTQQTHTRQWWMLIFRGYRNSFWLIISCLYILINRLFRPHSSVAASFLRANFKRFLPFQSHRGFLKIKNLEIENGGLGIFIDIWTPCITCLLSFTQKIQWANPCSIILIIQGVIDHSSLQKSQLIKIKKYLHRITFKKIRIKQICTACHWITPRYFPLFSSLFLLIFSL